MDRVLCFCVGLFTIGSSHAMFLCEAPSSCDGRLSSRVLKEERSFLLALKDWAELSSKENREKVNQTFSVLSKTLDSEQGQKAQLEKRKVSDWMDVVNSTIRLEANESEIPEEDVLVLEKFIYLSGENFYGKNLKKVVDNYRHQ